MSEDQSPRANITVTSHDEDTPDIQPGCLIPDGCRPKPTPIAAPEPQKALPSGQPSSGVAAYRATATLLGVSILIFALSLGSLSYSVLQSESAVASPAPVVLLPESATGDQLHYGVTSEGETPFNASLIQSSLKQSGISFINVDLTVQSVTYYENGLPQFTVPVRRVGQPGTWWETPPGLYAVDAKDESYYSRLTEETQLHTVFFERNFSIYGSAAEEVDVASYARGSIELDLADAAELFAVATENMPVLVHGTYEEPDTFVYTPQVGTMTTNHYLVADLENNSVLASNAITTPVPIASLTKLMTALVVAKELSLDAMIATGEESWVSTIIPRLESANSATVYSLLQLLLVESSNEAAERLAAEIGREQFIVLMNKTAAELGMNDTVFTDPTGLDGGNRSTLQDLHRLTKHLYENRRFIFEITAELDSLVNYRATEFGQLANFNTIDGIESFQGGKVGQTEAAGQTSISLHEISVGDTIRPVVIILLGSAARNQDVVTLMRYLEDQFAPKDEISN